MIAPLLAVVGLKREAALVTGSGLVAVASGGDGAALLARLQAAASHQSFRAVVSIGLGGALSPTLDVGDWVVADRIVEGAHTTPTAAGLTAQLQDALRALTGPTSRDGGRLFTGAIAASDVMVVDAAAKAALRASTAALAVDMESHVASAFAAAHGVPFAALRVVSDGANRALPKAAQAGMRADGGMDILAVLRELALDPRQLPALIRTGREAEFAFGRLKLLGRHNLLGRLGVGDADLGQLLLDMV